VRKRASLSRNARAIFTLWADEHQLAEIGDEVLARRASIPASTMPAPAKAVCTSGHRWRHCKIENVARSRNGRGSKTRYSRACTASIKNSDVVRV
jgi:hypothetical protein